jgi:hypothetical protein
LELLTHGENSWNSRCKHKDGRPSPWSREELWNYIQHAAHYIPAQGVKDWETEQRRLRLRAMVGTLKESILPSIGDRVPVKKLRILFERLDLSGLSVKELGDALRAQGIRRAKASKARTLHIHGLDYRALQVELLAAERERQIQATGTSGCPVISERQKLKLVS